MSEEVSKPEPVYYTVQQWEFDNYSSCRERRSRVEYQIEDKYYTERIVVTTDLDKDTKKLYVDAMRDQWGTWLTISIGEGDDAVIGVAQEDCTRSFLDAMISALERMKDLCLAEPPTTSLPENDLSSEDRAHWLERTTNSERRQMEMKYPHCDRPVWVKHGAFCTLAGSDVKFKIVVVGTNAAILETPDGKVHGWESFLNLIEAAA